MKKLIFYTALILSIIGCSGETEEEQYRKIEGVKRFHVDTLEVQIFLATTRTTRGGTVHYVDYLVLKMPEIGVTSFYKKGIHSDMDIDEDTQEELNAYVDNFIIDRSVPLDYEYWEKIEERIDTSSSMVVDSLPTIE